MMNTHPDSFIATLIKTVAYRAVSWIDTCFLAWLLIGNRLPATAAEGLQAVALFGTVDMITNTLIYFWFDRLWAHITMWNLYEDYHLQRAHQRALLRAILIWLVVLPVLYSIIIGGVYWAVY
jgi:hypothetical protein